MLLVDAVEGPLAQTKFVLAKALSRGLAPIVVLNKVDRPAVTQSRCDAVASQLFDLFHTLGADDKQLDFPILYASAKQVSSAAWQAKAAVAGSLSVIPQLQHTTYSSCHRYLTHTVILHHDWRVSGMRVLMCDHPGPHGLTLNHTDSSDQAAIAVST